MNKFLISLILIILFLSIIYIYPRRYIYIDKDKDKLYVTVKGHEYDWNKDFYDTLLKRDYPDKKEIVVKKMSNPDILIISHFNNSDNNLLYIDKNVPYITWSGESHRVEGINNKKAKYNLLSQKPEYENDIWFPYLISTNYFFLDRLENLKNTKKISERKYLVAYVASHSVEIRERFFKILNDKYNKYGTHALGKCSNNFKTIEGGHGNLDEIYEDYKFVFAMENLKKDGYITEKIMNAYRGGAIPIFYGDSKSAEKFFNKGTYIDLNDFDNFEKAADYIFKLSQDNERLENIKNLEIFKDKRLMKDIDYYINNFN